MRNTSKTFKVKLPDGLGDAPQCQLNGNRLGLDVIQLYGKPQSPVAGGSVRSIARLPALWLEVTGQNVSPSATAGLLIDDYSLHAPTSPLPRMEHFRVVAEPSGG